MTTDEMREYKKQSYERHKFDTQRNRVLTGLASRTRKPKEATLKKYGIVITDEGQIEVPQKKEKVIYKTSESTDDDPTVINVIRKRTQPRIQEYNTDNTLLNGEQLRNFITTVLVNEPQKGEGSLPLSKGEIKEYSKVGEVLYTIYKIPYNAKGDLTPLLNNADLLIKMIDEHPKWKSVASKARFLSRILKLSKIWRPMGMVIVPNRAIYNKLDAKYNEWSQIAKSTQLQVSATTPHYIYDDIRNAVILKYGEESFQSLLVQLYEEVLARDDLALTMAYKDSDILQGTNYLLLNRPKRQATVVLTTYKTNKKVDADVRFDLSKRLTNLIMRLKPPTDKSPTLFPIEGSKLKPYMMSLFKEIPFLKDEKIGIRYIRHSLISTTLLKLDVNSPGYSQTVADLAKRSMHNVAQQASYKSPLKDKDGNIISTQSQADELRAVQVTRSKTTNILEKPVEKPKKAVKAKAKK
jgi:hypothetical protein